MAHRALEHEPGHVAPMHRVRRLGGRRGPDVSWRAEGGLMHWPWIVAGVLMTIAAVMAGLLMLTLLFAARDNERRPL